MRNKAVIIVGPTAVGKTDLSIKLAQKYSSEIISGDSMQIYRKLNIGTAKITLSEMQGITHHLIDVCDINQRFTVYDFQKAANKLIEQINQSQKLPFIVGGTGFYIKALVSNLYLGGNDSTEKKSQIREKYTQLLLTIGERALWERLLTKDPVAAKKISPHNSRRIIRALEVIDLTGKQFSQQISYSLDTDYLIIGLTTQRDLLYQRINHRVDLMVKAGLEKEAYWLYQQRKDAPQAIQGIGYKEFFPYFTGEITYEQAIATIKQNSRHFAKRQLTYFRHQLTIHWFDLIQYPEQFQQILAIVKKFQEK